jgi:hypothetical protein
VIISAAAAIVEPAHAGYLVQDDDYYIRWDNTLTWSGSVRTAPQSQAVLGRPNTNDGDYAFGQGSMTSDRFDLFSEFDIQENSDHHYGLRLSADTWYDTVYNTSHKAVPLSSYNEINNTPTSFSSTARTLEGRDIMLDDALVHGTWDVGDHSFSVHAGRETLQWGESLFFAGNGVAGAMSPVDGIKASLVPGIEAKEIFLPVGQVSTSFQVNDSLTLAGYYQLEYRPTRAPVPGTYTSVADFVFEGAQSISTPGGPILHGVDQNPANRHGQFGVAIQYSNDNWGLDSGLYWVHYVAKLPQAYLYPTGTSYYFVYPKNINAVGVSFAKQIFGGSWGLELNVKTDEPLLNDNFFLANTSSNPSSTAPLWPAANVAHINLNNIQIFGQGGIGGVKLWDASSVAAEIAGEHVLGVTQNGNVPHTHYPRTALAGTVVYTLTWYQALPNFDLNVPLTFSDVFVGPSPTDLAYDGTGARHGGFVGVGLSGVYQNTWKVGVNYTRYFGSASADGGQQANQPYIDRDFVSFTVSRTF